MQCTEREPAKEVLKTRYHYFICYGATDFQGSQEVIPNLSFKRSNMVQILNDTHVYVHTVKTFHCALLRWPIGAKHNSISLLKHNNLFENTTIFSKTQQYFWEHNKIFAHWTWSHFRSNPPDKRHKNGVFAVTLTRASPRFRLLSASGLDISTLKFCCVSLNFVVFYFAFVYQKMLFCFEKVRWV